jgi:hypothetical protein
VRAGQWSRQASPVMRVVDLSCPFQSRRAVRLRHHRLPDAALRRCGRVGDEHVCPWRCASTGKPCRFCSLALSAQRSVCRNRASPQGYPLFCALSKLMTLFMPYMDIARSVNVATSIQARVNSPPPMHTRAEKGTTLTRQHTHRDRFELSCMHQWACICTDATASDGG